MRENVRKIVDAATESLQASASACPTALRPPRRFPRAKTSPKVSQKRTKHTRQPPPNPNPINEIRGIFRKKHPTPPFSTKKWRVAYPGLSYEFRFPTRMVPISNAPQAQRKES